jgi:hypothetical protein
VVASIIDSGLSVKSWEGNGMTKEELIYQARVLAFTARMDGSSSGARYDELADALEAATTNSELTVEWSICYASGQVMDKAMTEKKARAMAGQGGTRLIKRTVGPWEVFE